MNKGADCSIIAHSFGTFVIARILRDHTDLEFNRIIFCGSVVPQKFRFEDYRGRFEAPLVNEVGTRDFGQSSPRLSHLGTARGALTDFVVPLFAIDGTTAKLTLTF